MERVVSGQGNCVRYKPIWSLTRDVVMSLYPVPTNAVLFSMYHNGKKLLAP